MVECAAGATRARGRWRAERVSMLRAHGVDETGSAARRRGAVSRGASRPGQHVLRQLVEGVHTLCVTGSAEQGAAWLFNISLELSATA